jgi:hypothetical protein
MKAQQDVRGEKMKMERQMAQEGRTRALDNWGLPK